jgi:hypothetical protein
MTMRRRIAIALWRSMHWAVAGIVSLGCRAAGGHHGWHGRRDRFEQHVAQICADAALRARANETPR